MVRMAVDSVGGMGIPSGASVLIKPNINSNNPPPSTVNPDVLVAVISLVKEYSPSRVVVADRSNPNTGPTLDNMKALNIYRAATEAGAEVMTLDNVELDEKKPPEAIHWEGGFKQPKILDEFDRMVFVPIVKTHYIATYTMALKNAVGLIDLSSRYLLHSALDPDFGCMIAELHLARTPDFIIMDATKVFVNGGPTRGDVQEPRLIMATPDVIAADVLGLALLKHLGTTRAISQKSVWEQPQVARAVELGLGVSSKSSLTVLSDGVAEIEDIKAGL